MKHIISKLVCEYEGHTAQQPTNWIRKIKSIHKINKDYALPMKSQFETRMICSQ